MQIPPGERFQPEAAGLLTRDEARRLVERERARVALVAGLLVRHRRLSADAVRAYSPDAS